MIFTQPLDGNSSPFAVYSVQSISTYHHNLLLAKLASAIMINSIVVLDACSYCRYAKTLALEMNVQSISSALGSYRSTSTPTLRPFSMIKLV